MTTGATGILIKNSAVFADTAELNRAQGVSLQEEVSRAHLIATVHIEL